MAVPPLLSTAVRIFSFGGPEVLSAAQVPLALPLPPRQVLVRVLAVGVNPQETYLRSGRYPALPQLPFTPGKDFAGVVVQGGAECRWKAPQRVFGFASLTGAYANYLVAGEEQVFALPEGYAFEEGAGLGIPFFTAYRALLWDAVAGLGAGPSADKAVLRGRSLPVHGASGGVGRLVLQLARFHGMRPIVGTAGSEVGLRKLSESGLCDAVASHRDDGHLDCEAIRGVEGLGSHPFSGGPAFDVIIEMQAQANLDADVKHLNQRGVIVVVGNRGHETCEVDFRGLMQVQGNIRAFMGQFDEAGLKEEIRAALQGEAGYLDGDWAVRPTIGQVYDGDGGGEALAGAFARAHEEVRGAALGGGRRGVCSWGTVKVGGRIAVI